MNRALLVALLLLPGCRETGPSTQAAYDHVRDLFRSGKLVEARAELDRNGARWQSLPADWPWKFRLLEAEVLLAQAEPAVALALLQKQTPAPDGELETRRLADLADAYLKLEKIDEATRAIKEARVRAVAGGWPQLEMHTSLVESAALFRRRDFASVETVAASVLEKARALNDGYYASGAQINLSMVALRQKRFDDALSLSQQALTEARQAGALRFAAVAALNSAAAYSELGDFDRARQMQRFAADTLEVTGDQRLLQASLGELGNMYNRHGDVSGAIPLYERAYRVANARGMSSAARLWARNMAFALIRQKEWSRAREWNDLSRRLVVAADQSVLPYLDINDAEIDLGQGDWQSAVRRATDVREQSTGDLLMAWQAEHVLAAAARYAGHTAQSNKHFENAVALIQSASGQLRQSQFRITLRARAIEIYQMYVESLLDQRLPARALEVAEASRAQLLSERLGKKVELRSHGAAAEMIAKAKACGCTFLSYWLTPSRSLVWIVRPSGIAVEPLAGMEEIARRVTAWRRDLLEGFGDPLHQPTSIELAASLLGPVQRYTPPGSRVVVVPDGPMNLVNLEALPVNGHYWIEDVTLAATPSLLILDKGQSHSLHSALLVGAPTFSSPEFPVLRQAPEELRIIKTRLANVPSTLYQGDGATPAAYLKEASQRHSLIHFAAHADVRLENPFDSAIILSGPRGQERLYGYDIAAQKLEADLVTISACKSAGSRAFAGEGLTGLAWAFLQSGARRVIAGSWDVSDQSSKLLMDRLYSGLNKGEPPVESLRNAKLALLRSGTGMRHPFYWAPLQAYVRIVGQD